MYKNAIFEGSDKISHMVCSVPSGQPSGQSVHKIGAGAYDVSYDRIVHIYYDN